MSDIIQKIIILHIKYMYWHFSPSPIQSRSQCFMTLGIHLFNQVPAGGQHPFLKHINLFSWIFVHIKKDNFQILNYLIHYSIKILFYYLYARVGGFKFHLFEIFASRAFSILSPREYQRLELYVYETIIERLSFNLFGMFIVEHESPNVKSWSWSSYQYCHRHPFHLPKKTTHKVFSNLTYI